MSVLTTDIRAYIDGANLHKGIGALGWHLDYRRFRGWLRQKFGVSEAYIFMGLMAKHASLYTDLQTSGYQLIFKEVTYGRDGTPKGNCDADLVLKAARDHFEAGITAALLVSSDGDYAPLVRFYQEKGIPMTIISPSVMHRCSLLLRRTNAPIICLNGVRGKLERPAKNERAPGADVSAQGSLSS
jgi:uncharacterized LabA/DUF88 family protein